LLQYRLDPIVSVVFKVDITINARQNLFGAERGKPAINLFARLTVKFVRRIAESEY
jgi:hypothetical protein